MVEKSCVHGLILIKNKENRLSMKASCFWWFVESRGVMVAKNDRGYS